MIEALVASVLVAVGVTGALRGFGAITHAQAVLQERDRMQRLAVSKYDEIVVTGLANADTSGDFQDYNEPRYKWDADIQTTTTQDLQSLKVTVTATDSADSNQASVTGLVFTPQPATGGTP
jgi:Tfp pilus assembly protein PilV